MVLSDLERRIRLYVPGALPSVVTEADLISLINQGTQDVNQRLKVLRTNAKFNLIANLMEYTMTTQVVSDFQCMDESGLYFYDGSFWQQLFPKTRKWLDDNIYNWRSYAATNKPQYYFPELNKLTIFPAYNANVTNGGWIYYIAKPPVLTSGTQYPWTGTTDEIPELSEMDDGIIAYCQWKLSQPLGQKANGVIDEKVYEERLERCDTMLRSRPDLTNSRYFRMRGPYGWSGSGQR